MPSQKNNTRCSHPAVIAIDFGGTKIAGARILDYQIVQRKQLATDQNATPEQQCATVIELIQTLQETTLEPIGVAVSGRIDHAGKWHAVNENTLSGLSAFPLAQNLERHFDTPIQVMNDAVAAAAGEYRAFSVDRVIQSLLYVTVSTGVGGGLVLNGRPLQSHNGLAGHIGFASSPFATTTGRSGQTGTIESIASGTAIGRAGSLIEGIPKTGKEVFNLHLSGDPAATVIVKKSAQTIARAIADVRALLDIDLAVLGGSVGLAEGYMEMVNDFLQLEPILFRPELTTARLGANSALFGVAAP